MLEKLSGMASSLGLSQEEPAPVKARIVIKKGGQFWTESDANSPVDITSSVIGQLQSMGPDIGFDVNELVDEVNAVTGSMGLTDDIFTGYTDGQVIKVQMNPNSYTIRSVTSFKNEKMGGASTESGTLGAFSPPKPRVLSVKLFYDIMLQADYIDKVKNAATDIVNAFMSVSNIAGAGMQLVNAFKKFSGSEDISKLYLDKLLGLTRILKGINTPPLISFQYGSTAFEGYATSVSIEYQRFNTVGEVTRAEVSMSIEESNIYSNQQTAGGAQAQAPNLSASSMVMDNSSVL